MKIEYSRLHGREAEGKAFNGLMLFDRGSHLFVIFENHDWCKIRRSVLFGWRNCHGCPGPQDSGCSD